MKNLLLNDDSHIEMLNYAKKISIDGATKDLPVYRIPISELYYNDQNDRIATWISQYLAQEGKAFAYKTESEREEYNSIIEKFIINSNKERLNKTMNNIKLFNQREPGVVLKDGRIIDGNRRFTCLRLLSKEDYNFGYFEAVILDKDVEHDKKQIKLLELSLQHGTDTIVDYDPIDRLVGLYKDVEENKLLTVNEYAQSTDAKVKEVETKLKEAKLMVEFLEFIKAPKQYHIARDLAIDGPLIEIMMILDKEHDEDRINDLKNTLFTLLLVKPEGDITRFIREVKKLSNTEHMDKYIETQKPLSMEVYNKLPSENNTTLEFINEQVRADDETRQTMQKNLFDFTHKVQIEKAKNKPLEYLNSSIKNIAQIDTDQIEYMKFEDVKQISDKIQEIKDYLEIIEDKIDAKKRKA